MKIPHNPFDALTELDLGEGKKGQFYSLPSLEDAGVGPIRRLPVSIRLVLESILRNCDGAKIQEQSVRSLANWAPNVERKEEIPFVVARIVLQDFTGVPLLVDLAAMRSTVARMGKDPRVVEPLVPVDLVVDHSVQVDFAGSSEALQQNLEMEFRRNRERYQFLKWGMQAFETFKVIPPGIGIIHQVNLEYLAKGVLCSGEEHDARQVYYPDTLVGTDSHTTMINGLGIVGWGVGGIEAEAGMLGQPVYFLTPDVVGVHVSGELREGVTATDAALTVTQMLREATVVGKFVEFFGPGAEALPVVDRATIANMAPEDGATMGFFPIDEACLRFLRSTGRSEEACTTYERYYRAQGLFGMPRLGEIDYSVVIDFDLGSVVPSVAGPKRPQDRIELPRLKDEFRRALSRPVTGGGFGKSEASLSESVRVQSALRGREADHSGDHQATPDNSQGRLPLAVPALDSEIRHGSVLIASITSCTNTSNPGVMLAAGLLAKKALESGLRVDPVVKCSLAPGSRVVSDYLKKSGLQSALDQLGFYVVGYGCATCIGNSGPLPVAVERAVVDHDMVVASVLSGNRNFEARVHPSIKANFLMSPPLVVAFALAGRVDIDLTKDPLGEDAKGRSVYLKDLWPSQAEIRGLMENALDPEVYRGLYRDFATQNPLWNEVPSSGGWVYGWESESTYIQEPPFFEGFDRQPSGVEEIRGARALGIFGDSVTTDHISPAGSIKPSSPAGRYLEQLGVQPSDFNSFGSRRGNDQIMTRGTFGNVRIKNLMVPGTEGGVTVFHPEGEQMSIFDAAIAYRERGTPLIVIAGLEYGTGSSRDWAAKGTRLLGVRTVLARSFERIHRSNLVGMGILPLQFREGDSAQTLALDGSETFDVLGLEGKLMPQQNLTLRLVRAAGTVQEIEVRSRIDTPIEIDYFTHGGILPYVLRQLLTKV